MLSTQSPRRVSTGNAKRKDVRKQLLNVLRDELGSQTWHFSPDAFVRMVSPKTPHRKKKPDECLYLDDFHCESDQKPFKEACKSAVALLRENYRGPGSATWITETDENAHYDQVVDFLNDILKTCHEALQNPKDTLFQDVTFSNMHDITMMDRAIGLERLRPDIILEEREEWPVGTGDSRSDRAWWCKQEAGQRQTILACEVKKEWPEMIVQLGTYARSQFDAFPSRIFVLSIAFNHIEESACFVIFHRSGITASHLMNLKSCRDRGKFVRIFMAFMSWKNVTDAGFPDFNDNTTYKLVDTTWNITQRLYHTSCIRGRATIVVRVERSDGSDSSADFPAVPLLPRSQVHNPRKRASEDTNNTSKKRKTTGARSGASNLNKIDEGATDNSVYQRKFRIVQGNLCLPVRTRTHPPSHFLQKCTIEDAEDSDHPGNLCLQKKQVIIKDYCPLHTRTSLEKESFGTLHNAFGVANISITYFARASNGQLQTTSIFLPRPEVAKKYHWALLGKYVNPPEPRSRILIEMTSIGKSFLDCRPGKDLLTKVAHSMLGWFNVYQNGFLHRDVSIGNVLAFEKGEERLPFRLSEDFKKSLGEVTNETLKAKVETLGLRLSTHLFIPDAKGLARNLEELLKENGVGTFCEAFITDGDMAKDWRVVFSDWRKEKEVAVHERSGTELFMSSNLLNPERRNYVQSPVDDIESFLWVTLWAILTNNVEKVTGEMKSWAKDYEEGNREGALREFRKRVLELDARKTLIHEWATFSAELTERYQITIECLTRICDKNAWDSEEEEAQYWKAAWHGYALEGVSKSLEIIFRNVADMD